MARAQASSQAVPLSPLLSQPLTQPPLSFTYTHKHPIPSTLIHTNTQHTLHTSPYSTITDIHTQSP